MTPHEKAESDYTKAVETAARTGDWGVVAAAHQAIHQTRHDTEHEEQT